VKKTIVHIIDNLGRGGAETMLITVLQHLQAYNNVLVTLTAENEFAEPLPCNQYYCLHANSKWHIPAAAIKLRRIIKRHQAVLVHSHLFWSTAVARLATPAKIPLVTTIHAFVKSSLEYQPWHMRLAEQLGYRYRKSTIVAVAKGAIAQYFELVGLPPANAYHLYTFADTALYKQVEKVDKKSTTQPLRIVTVGNLKEQKNHQFLLQAMRQLKDQPITLHVYGKGPLHQSLQQTIATQQLNVVLKGQVCNVHEMLGQYDVFVMSSNYEGFALSVLEAMACGLPLLLSDIESFREQCADTACYYKPGNVADFVQQLQQLQHHVQKRSELAAAANSRMQQHFTLPIHLQNLGSIYNQVLATTEAMPCLQLANAAVRP
jgi:glycosyltransferase involved in cell wall biosynthesis